MLTLAATAAANPSTNTRRCPSTAIISDSSSVLPLLVLLLLLL